jgi:hypothetical protein
LAHVTFEGVVEVGNGLKAAVEGNLGDAKGGGAQHLPGFLDAAAGDVLGEGDARNGLKDPAEVLLAEVYRLCHIVRLNWSGKVSLSKASCRAHTERFIHPLRNQPSGAGVCEMLGHNFQKSLHRSELGRRSDASSQIGFPGGLWVEPDAQPSQLSNYPDELLPWRLFEENLAAKQYRRKLSFHDNRRGQLRQSSEALNSAESRFLNQA